MKPMISISRLALALMWASLGAGCAFNATEPALMYRLVIAPVPEMAPPRAAGDFELLPLRSNRPQGGSLGILVAQVGEVVRVDEFAAGRWEESPETVMERALAGALKTPADSNAGAGGAPRSALSRPRLRVALEQFEMVEPRRADDAYVAVAVSFQLLSPRDRLVLAQGDIQERQSLPVAASLDDIVLAFNRASSRVVSRFVAEVTGAR